MALSRELPDMVIAPGQRMTLDLPEEFIGLTGYICLTYREFIEVGGERVALDTVRVKPSVSFEKVESR